MDDVPDVLARFSDATRTWFGAAFAAPTPAQVGAWEAIGAGRHALVVAPTGSGKTLSAFLWSLDRLLTTPRPEDKAKRCRVLYISPLKALGVDVERNLRAPLTGIRHTADRLGSPVPEVTVGVRSGDTPAAERRKLVDGAAGHHDHHAGVAVPDADLPGARVPARRRDGDRRRGPRRRRHQAWRPPRGVPRTARRPARAAGAADRPVGHRAPAGGGGPVPRRQRAGRHRRPRLGQGVGPQGRGAGRGHDRTRRVRRGLRGPPARLLDLAARRGARRRPRRGPPLDDRLRQLPAAGRAAHRPAQRDRHRPGGRPRSTAEADAARRRRSWPSPGSRPARSTTLAPP